MANHSHETLNPPDTSQSSSPVNFRIATLNCRSLVKSADVSTRNLFIRYLRTRPLEILALQETHASTIPLQDTFHMQFQASDSLWSPHCGLVCFSPLLSFSNTKYSVCGRVISTKVTHVHGAFDPVTITVVYAPADRRDRFTFLEELAQNGASLLPEFGSSRHILLGDLNYTYATHLSSSAPCQASSSWLSYIDSYFIDCVTDSDRSPVATFSRGSSCSCIDYIFGTMDMFDCRVASDVTYIQPSWSDHFLVTSHFALRSPTHATILGKGVWRAHPRLASSETFQALVAHTIFTTVSAFDPHLSPQDKWDKVKTSVAHAAKSFSRRSAFTLTKAESLLHRKRSGIVNRLAANASLLPSLTPQLSIVESQLASIQQYHTETLALRAGIRWREQGELSAGYLKRTAAQRQTHQIMKQLLHPVTSTLCSTPEEMIRASVSFYGSLYTPDPIDDDAVEDLLSTLHSSLCLSASDQRMLVNSFTYDTLLDGVSRCPKRSSPGLDGLPYEILRLIFIHPSCRDLLLQVYNDALSKGIFPASWFGTSVSLLPKKGDLKDLKNWRPISLINTDAKVFTRLLNARIVKCASKLINPYQTGFLGGRFIADNGLLVKLIMEHARLTSSTAIGLLLDQEKAYDRVHPAYLCQVLHRFGFPSSIINSLSTLFFNTNLHLNINGFLSPPVPQRRGLRQGDPISPVLFNLAFEPLLRRILSSPHVSGFQLPRSVCSPPDLESRSKVKLLAYADDVVCFLNDPHELNILHEHLNLYAKASNAKVNFNKTEAVSLSGSRLCYQRIWRTPLLQQQIHSWHDSSSREPVIYLGFPLHSSIAQRDTYLTSLLSKITTGMQLHSHRSLSVRGRVTILNSLILSKLWHVLRILSVPKLFFKRLKSQISGFVSAKRSPRVSFETMCFPRNKGGLGVLNPHIQQSALQLRWLLPLLHDRPCSPTSAFWNHRSLQSSVVLPLLVDNLLRHSLPVGSQVPIPLDYRQAFVFPSLRPKALAQSSDGVFSLFFTAVDNLPHLFDQVVINPQTALCLKLGDVSVFSSSCPLPKSMAQLPCSLAYKFDPTKGRLQPKLPAEISIHPYLTKRFLKWVRLDQLKLQPFFIRAFLRPHSSFIPVTHSLVDMSPFLVTMSLVDHPGVRLRLTSRRYRRLCCPSVPSSNLYPNLTSSKWLALWRFPLRPQSRDIWYRLLHNKLPCRSNLYWTSKICHICNAPEETPSHFLLECPRKLAVWSSLWASQFEQPFSTFSLRCALFLLQFPTCSPTAIQEPSIFFGNILLAVWRNHWSSIFDQRPFTTSATISSANQLLSASLQEILISDGISPVPLPHLVLPCYSSRRRFHTYTGDLSFN